MDKIIVNPVKQNIRVKQFLGWFIAIIFPFAVYGIMEATKMPIVASVVYWAVCGVFLRYTMENRLPFFNPQIGKVKKEIILVVFATIICAYLYMKGAGKVELPPKELYLNAFLFAFFNGCFEHLVWVNIFDLAGCKFKLGGFFATFTYIVLIQFMFWSTFIPKPHNNVALFVFTQALTIIIPFIMYIKTRDITIWSIHRIIFNLLSVFFAGFGVGIFLHL